MTTSETHCPEELLMRALEEGELNEAISLQGWHDIDLRSLQLTTRFRSALKTCVEIRCQMDGMTPTDIIQKARFLGGYKVDFPEEFARIGIDRPSAKKFFPSSVGELGHHRAEQTIA